MGGLLLENFRKEDFIARKEPDFFVLLSPETYSRVAIKAIKDKLRKMISNPLSLRQANIKLNVKVGHASSPKDGKSLDAMLHVAQKRLKLIDT